MASSGRATRSPCPYVGVPELDTVLQGESHETAQVKNRLWPAGPTPFDVAQLFSVVEDFKLVPIQIALAVWDEAFPVFG